MEEQTGQLLLDGIELMHKEIGTVRKAVDRLSRRLGAPTGPGKPKGRPKGSKNKPKALQPSVLAGDSQTSA